MTETSFPRNSKRILFITRAFQIDGPRSIRTRKIIENLPLNYHVDVLCFNYGRTVSLPRDFTIYTLAYCTLSKCFIPRGTCSIELPNTLFAKLLKLFARILTPLLYPDPLILEYGKMRKKLIWLLRSKEYDAIIGSVYPFTVYLLGGIVKKHAPATKWILDIGDPMHGNSNSHRTFLMEWIAKWFERLALLVADKITVTNDATKEHFKKLSPDLWDRLLVVPQGFDFPRIPHKATVPVLDDTNLKLIYAGTFYEGLRDPKPLFSVVARSNNPPVTLDIYGPQNVPLFEAERRTGRIAICNRVGYDEMQLRYQQYGAVVFIDNATGVQTSGKIFELIATKKPILFIYYTESSPIKQLLLEYGAVVFAKNDETSIALAIAEIQKRRNTFSYEFDLQQHTWASRAKSFTQVFE